MDGAVRYRIQEDAVAPVSGKGARRSWALPIEDLEIGSSMILYMKPAMAHEKISAVRSFVSREQQRSGKKFSVYLSEDGICIFRRQEKEDGRYR